MEQVAVKIREMIETICRQNGAFLLDMEVKGGGRNRLVILTVDTEQGITLAECQTLSNEVSDLFYRKDVYSDGYRLEVTSPGVDKPLEHPFEFRRNIGRDLQVIYYDGSEEKEIVGNLTAYDENQLELRMDEKGFKIPVTSLRRVQVKLKW